MEVYVRNIGDHNYLLQLMHQNLVGHIYGYGQKLLIIPRFCK